MSQRSWSNLLEPCTGVRRFSGGSFLEDPVGLPPGVAGDARWLGAESFRELAFQPGTESFRNLANRLVAEHEQLQSSAVQLWRENARLRADLKTKSDRLAHAERRQGRLVTAHLASARAEEAETTDERVPEHYDTEDGGPLPQLPSSAVGRPEEGTSHWRRTVSAGSKTAPRRSQVEWPEVETRSAKPACVDHMGTGSAVVADDNKGGSASLEGGAGADGDEPVLRVTTQEFILKLHKSESFDKRSPFERWADLVSQRMNVCFLHETWRNEHSLASFTDVAVGLCKSSASTRGPTVSKTYSLRELDNGEECHVFLHPYSAKRALWDTLGMMSLLYECFAMPLLAFTVGTYGDVWENHVRTAEWFEIVSVVYWSMDIVLSFSTGHASAQGRIEMRLRKVARHYLRSFFALDLAITTVDWLTLVFSFAVESWGFARLGKTIWRLMRIFRLLRLMRVNTRISEIVSRMNSELLISFFGMLRLVGLVFIINHYTACGWYFVSQVLRRNDNWATEHLFTPSFAYAYLTSLHWSLTQFTPASMEVHPYNEVERGYNITVIILAMVVFSSFISSITNSMTHIQNLRAQQSKQEINLRRYLREHDISHELSGRVWHFVRTSRITRSRRVKLADIPCWKDLPNQIRRDLQIEIYLPVLVKHPVFEKQHALDPAITAKLCRDVVSEQSLMLHDDLFTKDQAIDCMFFVTEGSITYSEVLVRDRFFDECRVEKGAWACEIALWAHRVENHGRFRAYEQCVVVKINAARFREVMTENREVKYTLIRYANLYVGAFNAAGQRRGREKLLFNTPQIARELLAEARSSLTMGKSGSHILP